MKVGFLAGEAECERRRAAHAGLGAAPHLGHRGGLVEPIAAEQGPSKDSPSATRASGSAASARTVGSALLSPIRPSAIAACARTAGSGSVAKGNTNITRRMSSAPRIVGIGPVGISPPVRGARQAAAARARTGMGVAHGGSMRVRIPPR